MTSAAPIEPIGSATGNTFELCVGAAAFVEALRADLPECRESLWVQFSTFEGDASGTQGSIEKARSHSRDDGPAMSQS